MTIEDFTNKADGLINDFSGGASDEKEFRDGILDLLLEVATPAIQVQAKVKPANGGQVVRIFKDKNDNIYVKTDRDAGFMTRISDGTRHDGTTVGDFEFIKEIEC